MDGTRADESLRRISSFALSRPGIGGRHAALRHRSPSVPMRHTCSHEIGEIRGRARSPASEVSRELRRLDQRRPSQALTSLISDSHSAYRIAVAYASATRREAGNRVERAFRSEFRQRVLVASRQAVVLSRVTDVLTSQRLLDASAIHHAMRMGKGAALWIRRRRV